MPDSTPQRVILKQSARKLSREQRAGFGFVIAGGALTVVLGLLAILNHVVSPFDLSYIGPEFNTTAQRRAQEVVDAKAADTDGDTLNDYDEATLYKTSPYLSDSDSDGYNDATELASNTDPNCPSGAACEGTLYNAQGVATNNAAAGITASLTGAAAASTASAADINAVLGNIGATQVRTLLLQAGADSTVIESLTDDQVLQIYNEALAEMDKTQPSTP